MLYDRIQVDFPDILCPILNIQRKTLKKKQMEMMKKTNQHSVKNQYQAYQYERQPL